MEVLPLHRHRDLTDACAEILNSYWPRSLAARNHSLSQSCDHMPVCLAFIRQNSSKVLGFSKISAVQGIQNACLVESVIVREADRGKGLGRVLMSLTEDYAKQLGMKTMYLNTLDQKGFYAKIGYTQCPPVVSLGANAHRVPLEMLQKLMGVSLSLPDLSQNNSKTISNSTSVSIKSKSCDSENSVNSQSDLDKLSNQNILTSHTSLDPPVPPPLPPATFPASKAETHAYSRHVVKMDPHSLTWMKKSLF